MSDAATTAAAVAVALTLVEVVKMLVARLGGGTAIKLSGPERQSLFETERMTRDLHVWHAPSANGRQDWKGSGELLEAVRLLTQDVRELVMELRAERKTHQ